MSAAFVPAFTRRLTTAGRAEAWRLGNLVINTLAVVTIALVTLGIVFAAPLVTAFAGDYSQVPGKIELAISLARLMFPFLTLVALAAACMGMLNSLRRFFVPALSPTLFNVGTILTVILLVPVLRSHGARPIYAVAIGTLVGGLGQVVVQWPSLRREGFRYRPILDLGDAGLREILVLMGPGMIGLAAVQINVFVNLLLATSEGPGAISWLGYAFRLVYLPIGLFGLSVATAAVPTLSTHAAREDVEGMRTTLSTGLRMMLILNVPATIGLIVLADPIVALLFERGSFTPADTAATSAALVFYAPGLVGYSAVKLAVPSFYALRDSRTPVAVSAGTVVVNLALNVGLAGVLGYRGLALGTGLSAILNASVLLWLLRRRLGGLDGPRIVTAFLKVVAASLVMGAAAWAVERWLEVAVPGTATVARLVRVSGAIAAGMVTLAAAARVLRIAEFTQAVQSVTARLTGARSRP